MNELYYVYPMYNKVSFHFIAKNHIEHLRKRIKVQEIDENVLDNILWVTKKRILLHPIGYALLGDKIEMFHQRVKRLEKLLSVKERLGGFDTADSNRISQPFVDVLNKMDLVIVPSYYAKDTYLYSGVDAPVEVLPHGLPEEFLKSDKTITNDQIKKILSLKRKHKARLVLFNLTHSGYRKGADIVFHAMRKVQSELDNVFLVVKRGDILDPYLNTLRKLKMIEVAGYLDYDSFRQLYDICDICVVPSRGGGFEHNALEAIARGVPTIVPNSMCFLDYIQYMIPVEPSKAVKPLPNNPIHIGYGFEVSYKDLANKIRDVLDNYSKYKRTATRNAKKVRKEYSWSKICETLWSYLIEYEFVR